VDQKRLLLAFGLSFVLLILYQELVLKPYQRPQELSKEDEIAAAPTGGLGAPEGAPPPGVPDAAAAAPSNLAAPAPAVGAVTVDTERFRVSITPVGARLVDVALKGYRQSVEAGSAPLKLVQPSPVLPMTLQLGADTSDAAVVYRADRSEVVLSGSERGEVVFVAESPGGLHLEKRYAFAADSYAFDVTTRVSGGSPPGAIGLVLTPMPPDGASKNSVETAVALAEGRLTQKALEDLHKQVEAIEASTWAGFAAQYFLTAVTPPAQGSRALMSVVDGLAVVRVDAPLRDGETTFTVYAGPKERAALAQAGHHLDRALDFGWFWFVAVPLLQMLHLLYALTGNYGVAIIVLTTLVKLATVPLTQFTFRNMREMQKIQPQMAKLRERFKDDRAELQREMMELYRRHRVNPLSGCLPMVLQIPIFIGLYNALLHAIELRHAPFVLWIRDLSAPDWLMIGGIGVPVLCILMGASMLLQQWLTPQQGDPTQQRMMMFMPIIFTFMFINFPSGLVLYWLVNNVLGIGQQYLVMRSGT
jgi:YidC/Oxa1 family membrane protein insertase